MSYPLRWGENEWGIVLFSDRTPNERFSVARSKWLSAEFFVEKTDGLEDRLRHEREADLLG